MEELYTFDKLDSRAQGYAKARYQYDEDVEKMILLIVRERDPMCPPSILRCALVRLDWRFNEHGTRWAM